MNDICKICGSKTKEIVNEKNGQKFYFCSVCEFIAGDEDFTITNQEELKLYDYHNNSIEDFKLKLIAFFY